MFFGACVKSYVHEPAEADYDQAVVYQRVFWPWHGQCQAS